MPILDIELVSASQAEFAKISPRELADALGKLFGTELGRTWVRLRFLRSDAYAENESTLAAHELPGFVTVLLAHVPVGDALNAQALAITQTVAQCVGRAVARVHVQYLPAAAGRQAFGGKLVG